MPGSLIDLDVPEELSSSLLAWARGLPPLGEAHVPVVLVDGAPRDAADRLAGTIPDDALVLRAGGDPAAAPPVEISGDIATGGGELAIGQELFVQVERYDAAAFLPVAGPTLLRVTDDDDLAAFVDDADRARADGVFPDALLHPMIHVADQCGLTGRSCGGLGRRAYVGPDRAWRTTPAGPPAPPVGGSCSTTCVPPGIVAAVAAARAARPWLARYLAALDVLRAVADRYPATWAASGFGAGSDQAAAAAVIDPTLPYLLASGRDRLVFDPRTRAVASVGVDAGRVVELLLVDPDDRDRAVSDALAVPEPVARQGSERVAASLADAGITLPTAGDRT